MSGAEVQQPGLTLEVPEPSLDAQEIPLQSPRARRDGASQVVARRVWVWGCGGWGQGENDLSDALGIENAGVSVKGAGREGGGAGKG